MDKEYFDKCIKHVGAKLISLYEQDGIIMCGINGPYDDPETRVRNLSHLIVITAIEVGFFHNDENRELLKYMGDELAALSDNRGIYCMRKKAAKDSCNGVIGHAWVLEAYYYLCKIFGAEKYLDKAKRIIEAHKFNENMGLWGRPNQEMNDRAIDYTLNHQLWFAASACEINLCLKDNNLARDLNLFMEKLNKNMFLAQQGRISHEIYNRIDKTGSFRMKIKRNLNLLQAITNVSSFKYKEEGYHVFNIMALARIFAIDPDYSFFQNNKMKKVLEYINNRNFLSCLLSQDVDKDLSFVNKITEPAEKDINIYAYPYNVPGFELLYINSVIKDKIRNDIVEECINKQFEYTYDKDVQMFGNHCHDKNTINYRIYEYYRYLEVSNE